MLKDRMTARIKLKAAQAQAQSEQSQAGKVSEATKALIEELNGQYVRLKQSRCTRSSCCAQNSIHSLLAQFLTHSAYAASAFR